MMGRLHRVAFPYVERIPDALVSHYLTERIRNLFRAHRAGPSKARSRYVEIIPYAPKSDHPMERIPKNLSAYQD
jgi:hypothetical protein